MSDVKFSVDLTIRPKEGKNDDIDGFKAWISEMKQDEDVDVHSSNVEVLE